MKVAAYQAPLEATHCPDILGLIRKQIDWCELNDVQILCCPEAVLGGLADYAGQPIELAINVDSGELARVLAPLTSDSVTTILGFTEMDEERRLYNSAAVFHKGSVIGTYRKVHPFINKSIYNAGSESPVFTIGDLTFGIIICLDSHYEEPARTMVAKGASLLFIASNNGMPQARGGAELVTEARKLDVALARENDVYVIRADVAGHSGNLVSYGSSVVVDRQGKVLQSGTPLMPCLIVANIEAQKREIAAARS